MKFTLDELDWEDFNFNEGWEKKFKGDVRKVIAASIKHAKKKKGLNRETLVMKLKEITGVKLTVNRLNKLTRRDSQGHRFPYEYAWPLAKVTGDPRIIMFMAANVGLKVLTPDKMTSIEISRAEENKIFSEIQDIKSILKDLKRPSIIQGVLQIIKKIGRKT